MKHPYTKLLANIIAYAASIILYALNAGGSINGLTILSIALAAIASINLVRAITTITERKQNVPNANR